MKALKALQPLLSIFLTKARPDQQSLGFASAASLGSLSLLLVSALSMSGCGSDSTEHQQATSPLIGQAQSVNQFSKSQLYAALQEIDPLSYASTPEPICDISVKKIRYHTVGAAGEATTASAAVMLPMGDNPSCQGERPLLLYAHGTAVERSFDYTQVGSTTNEAGLRATSIAANFAAQGYIVVAPNYAGFDTSELDYHPYLNASQQSQEMLHALAAARDSLHLHSTAPSNRTQVRESGKLFISGYSQGGHVALATAQRLQLDGQTVTAIAPMSGPYAMAAFGDQIFSGQVNLGATVFAPYLAENYQRQYGNLYTDPSEVFSSRYAATIEDIVPSSLSWDNLLSSGKLPQSALFQLAPTGDSSLDAMSPPAPLYAYGFDSDNYLIHSRYRQAYLADAKANPDGLTVGDELPMPAANPQHPMRQALKANDLRAYIPNMPVLLCGGNQDMMVYYDDNTTTMRGIWQQMSPTLSTPLNVTVLDVDTSNATSRTGKPSLSYIGAASRHQATFDAVAAATQSQFGNNLEAMALRSYVQAYQAAIAAGKDDTVAKQQAQQTARVTVATSYHSGLTAPACISATRAFFAQF